MSEEPAKQPGLAGWAKALVGIIGLLGVGGGATGLGSFVKGDADKQEIDKRIAVVEVQVGNLSTLSNRTDAMLANGLSKQEATTSLVLGKIDILVSKVDQMLPNIDEARRRWAEVDGRITRVVTFFNDNRKDLKNDLDKDIEGLTRRVENIERRLLRDSSAGMPTPPGPIVDGDAAPWITPGDPSRPHR